MTARDYLYYDVTISLCSQCLRKVEAKIVFQDGKVFLLKKCRDHAAEKVLIATDIQYYKRSRDYLKPGDLPKRFNTKTEFGCPYDCGLCPDHEQHSCVSLIEVTDRCNLTCPTCYSNSSPSFGSHRTMEEIERMLDAAVANEGTPDVVQISGGEPTVHPKFFEILDLAKTKPIRHLMINTNGIRIAEEAGFAEKLAKYKPAFEVYLQFDSFRPEVLKSMRGKDLTEIRRKALERLNALNISTTLVVTLQKGLNTDEIGKIIEFAVKQPCVRGVTLQPTQSAGRLEHFNPETDRYTLTEVRRAVLDQTKLFTEKDLIPVPCHPEGIAMAYAVKAGGKVLPLSHFVEPETLLMAAKNTINFEKDPELKKRFFELFSTGNSPESTAEKFKTLLCCIPQIDTGGLNLGYDNIFRVVIIQFYDAFNFDIRPIKKTCVHMATPDGKLIPFDTMNLFYRPEYAQRLAALREEELSAAH
jgi:hypothetical protein